MILPYISFIIYLAFLEADAPVTFADNSFGRIKGVMGTQTSDVQMASTGAGPQQDAGAAGDQDLGE